MKIDRLLIGDNPFNGVNHRSRELGSSRTNGLSEKKIAKVVEVALDNGAQGFVFSATPKMLSVLRYMKENGWNRELNLYPIIPDVSSLVNESAELGMTGLISKRLADLPIKSKLAFIVKGGIATLSTDPVDLIEIYLETEYSRILRLAPKGAQIKSLFLHEVVSDSLVGLGGLDIISDYCSYVARELRAVPGLVTRNFVRMVKSLEHLTLPNNSVALMAPFNSLGFQMNPSRELCEKALMQKDNAIWNIIAMSILAAGSLTLQGAVAYLSGLTGISSCVVGVSTETHAMETFSFLRDNLQK